MSEIQETVRARYADKALKMAETSGSCCDEACCSDTGCGEGYNADEIASVGMSPTASLGCGNPTLLADLRPGETVLDLGSGAGLDVLLSARRVSPGGHAYGVDMTDEMLAVPREAFRVLRPAGRLAVADMVAIEDLSADVKKRLDLWAGCIAGTISLEAYTSALRDAGFRDVDIEITREVRLEGVDGRIASAYIRARKPALVTAAS